MREHVGSCTLAALAATALAACAAGSGECPGIAEVAFDRAELGEAQELDLSARPRGLWIVAETVPGEDRWVGIERLETPGGGVLVERGIPSGDRALSIGRNVVTLAVPSTEAMLDAPLEPGRYRLTMFAREDGGERTPAFDSTPAAGRANLRVFIAEPADGLALDLALWMPERLAGEPALSNRIEAFHRIAESLFGIGRGEVSVNILPERFDEVVGKEALREWLASFARSGSGPRLEVVVTAHLEPDEGAPVHGITAAIPGVLCGQGRPQGSIGVAFIKGFDALGDARVIAHELGHFVGLRHTSEWDGVTDVLSDTPVCTDLADKTLSRCPDASNLMFPSFLAPHGSEEIVVSDMQRRIVRAAPLFRRGGP
jgi:hypothetical protein